MKVYIGPYKNAFTCFDLVDKLTFWVKKKNINNVNAKPDWAFNIGIWLSEDKNGNPTVLYKTLNWFNQKFNSKRKVDIKIHQYDTWSMDATLALIILPMLKQLKNNQHGSAFVELEDVPEYMRTTNTEDYDYQTTFDFYNDENDKQKCVCDVHTRWNWVLNEMIWAFEQLQPDNDWESKYWITKPQLDLDEREEDKGKEVTPVRWKVEGECDINGRNKHRERINNGLRLFGVYFNGLWD